MAKTCIYEEEVQLEVIAGNQERTRDFQSVREILQQLEEIEKAVMTGNNCLIERVLRALPRTRRKLNTSVLTKLACVVFWGRRPNHQHIRQHIICDVDPTIESISYESEFLLWNKRLYVLPETEIYVYLLVLVFMIDKKRCHDGVKYADMVAVKLSKENRRSLDSIQAKCYFYYSLAYEKLNNKSHSIRRLLHERYQTAFNKHDTVTIVTLINCLLRNYVLNGLYFQAEIFAEHIDFPKIASFNEWARYLYYVGRTLAVRLEYTPAHRLLVDALRKAPERSAIGFKQTVKKLIIIVELLLGEIPDRAQFNEVKMRRSLTPYFHLTKAIFNGSLTALTATVEQFGDTFGKENNLTMILRLRYSVIRVGLKRLEISYSRISLDDVARKLQLDSAQEAEYIVAKAICDNLIKGQIDHENGHLLIPKTEPDDCFSGQIIWSLQFRTFSWLRLYRETVSKMTPAKSSEKK